MRIALVGPTHPIKGGIAQHTTVLARRLAEAGHDVEIVSWRRQYPNLLYPGQQTVTAPELPPFSPTRRELSWNRPDSWAREARRLRACDLVVFAHVTPLQVPAYLTMIRALRRGAGPAPSVTVICHNVLPHERRRTDVALVSRLLRAADLVLVHSPEQTTLARTLTDRRIVEAPLPPAVPSSFTQHRPDPGEHRRIVFFGLVRPYKGVDVLLRALARGPDDVRLRIAGEVWGGVEPLTALCAELGISDRVELQAGYVDAAQVPGLFRDADALVLPYRAATGSQAVWVGFEFGLPVIVTRAGSLADDVRDGVDGILADPDDVDSLADALSRFYTPGTPERLRERVRPIDPEPYWHRYLDRLLDPAPTERNPMPEAAPPGGRALHVVKRVAEQALWTRVAISRGVVTRRRRPLMQPAPVPPCDVLRTTADVEQAVAECRRLGLPLHHDRPKNWDALGAVSTVVHAFGSDARVLDAGAARYSSVLPWLRMYGLHDLVGINLEFERTTRHGSVRFEPGDITDTRFDEASFDAITCMSVIEHGVPLEAFLREAARLLRPGGLLVVSTDYDQQPPDTHGITAYGAPVRIFGPEDIRTFVELAAEVGLAQQGELFLEHAERPVHWKRTGLDYTFIRVTFVRRG